MLFGISIASRGAFDLWHLVVLFICGLLHLYGISWWFCSMASRGGFHSWSLASLLHLVVVSIFGISWCFSVVVFCISTASRGVFHLWHLMVAFTCDLRHLYMASGGVFVCFHCGISWLFLFLVFGISTASRGGFVLLHLVVLFTCERGFKSNVLSISCPIVQLGILRYVSSNYLRFHVDDAMPRFQALPGIMVLDIARDRVCTLGWAMKDSS